MMEKLCLVELVPPQSKGSSWLAALPEETKAITYREESGDKVELQDNKSRAVFVICSLYRFLATALRDANHTDVHALSRIWQAQLDSTMSLLSQFDKVVVVDIEDVERNGEAFNQLLNSLIGTEISVITPEPPTFTPLQKLMVSLHVSEKLELIEIFDEHKGIITLFGDYQISEVADIADWLELSLEIQNQISNMQTLSRNQLEEEAKQKEIIQQTLEGVVEEKNQLTDALNAEHEKAAGLLTELQTEQRALDESKQIATSLREENNSLKEVIKKHETTHANLNEQLTVANEAHQNLEQQLTSASQAHAQSSAKVTELSELLKAAESTRTELEHVVKAHQAELSEANLLAEKLLKQNEASTEQVAKLQATVAELEPIASRVPNLEQALKEQSEQLQQANLNAEELNKHNESLKTELVELSQVQQELELSELQLAQLQEELELAFQTNGELTKSIELKAAELTQLAVKLSGEQEKVSNLQGEREQTSNRVTELELQVSELTNVICQLEAENHQASEQNEVMKAEIESQMTELELSELQLAQLKEELEASTSLSDNLQTQLEQVAYQSENLQRQVADINDVQPELELAELQIAQLQEELEFYYAKYLDSQQNPIAIAQEKTMLEQHAFENARIGSIEVTGHYQTEGYRDVQLLIQDLTLVDGRAIDELPCKVFVSAGRVGLELRRSELTAQMVRWNDDWQDEYGHYLLFMAEPNKEQKEKVQPMLEWMNANERLLFLSVSAVLGQSLQEIDKPEDIDASQWRNWKLDALMLAEQIEQLPNWLSMDNVQLKEEYQTDGYEHLWIKIENLLFNRRFYPVFDFKIAATDTTGNPNRFAEKLIFAFRQLENGDAPFEAWPPIAEDDFGAKFEAVFDWQNEHFEPAEHERLSTTDELLFEAVVKNINSILTKLEQNGGYSNRGFGAWKNTLEYLQSSSLHEKIEVRDSTESVNQGDRQLLEFSLIESVDLGGYKHLLFVDESGVAPSKKFKIRAENINLETLHADIQLEVRADNNDLPFSDTAYVAEDEFGPRLLIPLDHLLQETLSLSTEDPNELSVWMFYQQISALVQSVTNEDERQEWESLLVNAT